MTTREARAKLTPAAAEQKATQESAPLPQAEGVAQLSAQFAQAARTADARMFASSTKRRPGATKPVDPEQDNWARVACLLLALIGFASFLLWRHSV